jgi:hypothetical protein
MTSSDEKITKLFINEGVVSTEDELRIGINLDFMLHPNPSTSSQLFIDYMGTEIGLATINLYSINGMLIKQQKEFTAAGQQFLPIDITTLSKGNYLIELEIGEKRGIAKFVVQ